MKAPPYEIGGVKIGVSGKPLLIGSLFYRGDKKVLDRCSGEVDCKKVKNEVEMAERLSRRVGLPHAIDIIAETPEAMRKYLEILSEVSEGPLLIGGLNEETRTAGYKKACEMGIAERCGVNSISQYTSDVELSEMASNRLKFAIIQTLDPSAVYAHEKVAMLKDSLIGRCESYGVEGVAVDVGVIDFTSVHLAVEAMRTIRKELGLPSGCAPSNAAYLPLGKKKLTRKSARAINVALNTMVQLYGADFIIYGPLRASSYIFEAVAVVEAIKAYGERLAGAKIADRDHPLYRFLPRLQ